MICINVIFLGMFTKVDDVISLGVINLIVLPYNVSVLFMNTSWIRTPMIFISDMPFNFLVQGGLFP